MPVGTLDALMVQCGLMIDSKAKTKDFAQKLGVEIYTNIYEVDAL